MNVAVIGTGTMGSRIVSLLSEHGNAVTAFDPSQKAREEARNAGAVLADSPKEATKNARIVFLSLPKPEHVRTTMTASDGALASIARGAIIVDTSTVDPDTSEAMAREAAVKECEYLDAPILGRPAGIGSWVMPVGGSEAGFTIVKPVLEIIARHAVLVGPVGSGNKVKLINQLMFASCNMVYCEILSLAQASGIGAAPFFDILRDSGASSVSGLFLEIGRRVTERDFDPDFSIDLLVKDLALSSSFVAGFHGATSITGLSLPLARMAQAAALGDEDNASMYKLFLEFFQGDTQ